ncbi:MAG: NUDIX domain-containing protein [Clostridiales bacterium]|nr:NUDIX domain-containing protein [Clostridiales bacterium]
MARQPKQIHVYLYRKRGDDYEYAVFRRADMEDCFQGICGGLEGSESYLEGAKRELFEEAGIEGDYHFRELKCISYLPDNIFDKEARAHWGNEIVVVPMRFFALEYEGEIKLSEEHSEVRWLPFSEAYELILFSDQKVALYELHQRLLRGLFKDLL